MRAKMLLGLWLFVVLAMSLTSVLNALARDTSYKCPLGNQIDLNTEMELRIPGQYPNNVPASCQQAAGKSKDQWRLDDLANVQRIAYQACSYSAGWLEYVPGTCQAGGPPPLCPVNHWYHDPYKAKQQHDSELS